jgi:putative oxidoreductase
MNSTTIAHTSNQHLTGQASAARGPRALLARALATDASWTQALLRVTLGAVMFPHGAQKALGWFGGYGFSGTMNFFTEKAGLPTLIAFLVIAFEFAGSILLLAGLGTRFAAAGIAAVMIGAITTVHASNGFFMNWFGNQAGEGFEYHLLVLGLALALILRGGGRASLDRSLSAR